MKFLRLNYLTPIPHAPSLEALNARLVERCLGRQIGRAGRHEQTIGERLAADRAAFRELPAAPLEACHKVAARVSSQALVRYRTNDYSVPTRYGYQDVLVKGFVDEVGHFLRRRRDRPPCAQLRPRRFCFRTAPLPRLARAKARRAGSGGAFAGLDLARRARPTPSSHGSAYGQARQTRVHPGSATD